MDAEISELEAIDASRADGVGGPATGIGFLMLKQVAKGARDCPRCDKSYDADHKGNKCENCGADLPGGDAAKAADDGKVKCPTCKGDGKILGNQRDCPDCDATGKVTPDKARQLAAKSLVRGILKAVADGKVHEQPDIDGGTAVLGQIADLIIAEAQELKAGQAGEIADIQQLACAAEMIWCWRTGEESVAAGSVMPATALMQSAAETAIKAATAGIIALGEAAEIVRDLTKAKHSAADRRKMAEQGNALSDGSYPIGDEEDLKSAAILAQSGHGDVEGAKRLIGRRAKELGVKNPLEDGKDDTAKSAIAQEGATVDTATQAGDLTQIVKAAVTEATAPLTRRIEALDAELAKVKAAPVPGGPVLSRNVQVKAPGAVANQDWAAKAARAREMASQVTDQSMADGYRALAREYDAKAAAPATA